VLATRIGFPVALKIASRAISHKTEAGGVRLNLATADAVGAPAKLSLRRPQPPLRVPPSMGCWCRR
jgi:acetyltransferase